MKKYAAIMACLVMAGSAIQTKGFAQTSGGSPGAGTGASQTEPGKPDASTGTAPNNDAKSGTINEPSGAEAANKSGVIQREGGGKVKYQRDGGMVTLQGNVANEAEKQAIEDKVKGWSGVTSVNNMLQVEGQGIHEPSGAERKPDSGTLNEPSKPDSSAQPDKPETKTP